MTGTCQTKGKITETCKKCGVMFTKTTSYGSHTYESEFPCSEEACSVCGHVRTMTGKQGHDYCGEERIISPATCTESGEKAVKCKYGCGSEITVEIPATGHTYGSWASEKAPTCAEEGKEKAVCTVCHEEKTRTIPKDGHVWATKVTENPTCLAEGKEVDYCTVCGHEGASRTIPKTAHKLGRRCATHGCHADGVGCSDKLCHFYVDTCVYCGSTYKDGAWTAPVE